MNCGALFAVLRLSLSSNAVAGVAVRGEVSFCFE